MSSYNQPNFTKGIVQYTDFDLSFRPNPVTGDLAKKFDLDSIKQSISNLINTRLGDRPFQPNVGGDLYDLLFEPLDDITKFEIKQAITTTINNFEPRVRIAEVGVSDNIDGLELNITLKFSIVNIPGEQTLSFIVKRVR